MKKISRLASIIMVTCFAFTATAYAQNNTNNTLEKIDARLEEMMEETTSNIKEVVSAEAPAKEQYQDLLSQLQIPVQHSETRAISSNNVLNDYYGGAYLNENKELTICSTSNDESVISLFKQSAGSNNVVIKKVNYRWDDLEAVSELFVEKLSNYRQKGDLEKEQKTFIYDIVEGYTDVFTNKYVIGIHELDQKKIALFWELFDLPAEMICLKSGEPTEQFVSIRPGGSLFRTLGSSTGTNVYQSVGYRGYRMTSAGNKVYGFTSCGHGSNNSSLYKNGSLVGELFDLRCGGKYDISFYDATTNASLSNVTSYSDDVGNSTETVTLSIDPPPSASVLLGSTAMKVGAKTFFTMGRVESTDFISYTNNYSYTNLIKAKAYSNNGDSGGAAFIYHNGKYYIIGTIAGGNVSARYSIIAQYQYARNALASTIHRY